MIDAAAVDLLRWSVTGEESPPGHDLSAVADVVTALEAVGALEPARDAVGRLVALAGRLGMDIPPALRAAAPPGRLPDAWTGVLENRDRRDGPHGAAPAAAVLPELDGTRFVLAGLRSEAARAELHVMVWGWPDTPLWLADADGRTVVLVCPRRPGPVAHRHGEQRQLLQRRPQAPAAEPVPAAASAGHVAGGDGGRPVRPGDGHGTAGLAGTAVSTARTGPPDPPWWALLPPAQAEVSCGEQTHRLLWAEGRLTAADHPDAEGELVLAALGGDRSECVDLVGWWGARRDDLEVLAVGPALGCRRADRHAAETWPSPASARAAGWRMPR